ncbi:hypothetical protein EBZ80_19820, partial [bacterium]|nr:hypothetical protein [bacterium]
MFSRESFFLLRLEIIRNNGRGRHVGPSRDGVGPSLPVCTQQRSERVVVHPEPHGDALQILDLEISASPSTGHLFACNGAGIRKQVLVLDVSNEKGTVKG